MHDEAKGTLAAPTIALALLAGAGLLLGVAQRSGFLSDRAESLFILLAVTGWVLLLGALSIALGYAMALSRRWARRREVGPWEVAWGVAALGSALLVAALFPLWGTGTGFGG